MFVGGLHGDRASIILSDLVSDLVVGFGDREASKRLFDFDLVLGFGSQGWSNCEVWWVSVELGRLREVERETNQIK